MRILRLRFRNLNSLAGDWDIDFTHPDYVSSGIFAITGPTGAGKTTILDGICLALYGQTPRLSKITQGENEIMSRQTGECSSEVEFETAKGRFRCHWSQHRSRKQADGQLQAPRHEIADAENGNILESKLKAVAARVEAVTGMDFDRFTRSMLLAQGGFAAFLQARPDERAPILEQITGTEIYSHISMKVHERTAEERRKLGEMRAELDGIRLLAPEEEQSLRRELAESQLAETTLSVEAKAIQEAQAWRERIAALESELVLLDQAWLSLEAKKKAAEPELERLARAGRALSFEGDYAHVCAARKQQQGEQAELAAARERLPRIEQGWQVAVAAREEAEAGLNNARCHQAQEAELIREARELDVKLREADSRILGLQAEMERCRQQGGEYRAATAKCDEQVGKAGKTMRNIELFLAENGADAGLVEALTGIEQQVRIFKALDRQCSGHRENVGRQSAVIEAAKNALAQAEAAWQKAEGAVTESRNRLEAVRAAREGILLGRELSGWRDEVESLTNRQNRLTNLQESIPRIEKSRQKLAELKDRLELLEQRRQELARLQERLAGECALREEVARQVQDKVVLLNRVRSLEEERRHLVDGAPCPLCGATEHPYAAGNVPRLDQAQQELEQAVIESKKVGEQLSNAREEYVGVTKELEQAERERLELHGQLANDQSSCQKGVEDLGLDADPAGWTDVVRIAAESCRELVVSGRAVIREAERKELEERREQSALDRAGEELARHDKARLAAVHGYETAVNELDRLERESASLHDSFDRALAEVERAVEPYGYKDASPKKIDEILASLTARRGCFVQRMQAKESLERELAGFRGEKEKQQALLAEVERNLAEKELDRAGRVALREELAGRRRELYGGRDPDREEKRLADALHQAGERRDNVVNEQTRLQTELAGLNQLIQRLVVSTTSGEERIAGLESGLRLRLVEAGFADEASFLQARLPPERYDEIMQWADSLRKEETETGARKEDRRVTLQSEQEKALTEKTLEEIREMNSAITVQLSGLQKELGALEQKLQHHAEQQQRHRARLQEIDLQKQECARWERLHALIGSSDGKKFRNFAQGLTFELMVAHANRQLQKMSDRYILVRDAAEPLELNVIDNYQAGEIRSTKNLSGGESFIASLALSLGLSSMASRNVRVDSLFLDEGFGTLDEDALETALETLSGLQQEGKLIGIISHVPALKERIGTQIQVDAGSSGRSTLSGPGCRGGQKGSIG